jgi:hypothetical protein
MKKHDNSTINRYQINPVRVPVHSQRERNTPINPLGTVAPSHSAVSRCQTHYHLRCVHGSEYGAPVLYPALYPVTCCIGMAAGAGSYSGRYADLRRLVTRYTAARNAAIPPTAATTKTGILYFWKKPELLFDPDPDPDPAPWKVCEPVVSDPPSRVATKSAWAAAGFVVERI